MLNKLIRIIYSYLLHDNVKCAKKLGVKIGTRCKILDDPGKVFGTEPWLISVGNHVEITNGVRFLSHEGAIWVIRELNKKYKNSDLFMPTKVGNNVMIGMNSIIMPGVKIGNNVIIGSHSVVTKDIPDNIIVAGVPAKKISNTEGFMQKKINSNLLVNTKRMSQKQKRNFIKQKYPEWF